MEPLEYEVRRRPEPRDTTGVPGRGYVPARGSGPWNGDSLSVVARFLSVADYEAAAITQQASYQAAMITRQVAYEAAEIREAAKREADQIRQQATLQATAVRQAAELEAAEVRTAVMSMQAELSEFAARLTDTLPNRALPPMPPAERSAVRPAPGPAGRPKARTSTAPTAPTAPAAPVPRPGGRSARKPASGRGRQLAAMRFAVIATSALFLVAVAVGAMEIHLHGFDFFVFRSTGTGETGPTGSKENQGPGQPDAPKPTPSHIKVHSGPHGTVTGQRGQ